MTSEVRTPIKQRFGRLARRVADAGAALVSTGERFRFYQAMSESPRAAAELARRSGTSEQFVKDWLVAQVAGDYIVFDPRIGRYANWCSLPRSS